MRAISGRWSGTEPQKETRKPARCVYCGVVAGAIAGVTVLIASTTSVALANGCEPVSCAAFGTTMTILLSQPAALLGALVGAACGGIVALICRIAHLS